MDSILLRSPWPEVKTQDEALYLGVLFGFDMSVDRVFAAAYRKFSNRMSRLVAHKSQTAVTKRIIFFNRLALPIFSYLMLSWLDHWITRYITGSSYRS